MAKKRNTSELAYDRSQFLLQLVGGECPIEENTLEASIADCNEAIEQYLELMEWTDNPEEIAQLRRDIQKVKVQKRRIKEWMKKELMNNNSFEEVSATA